MPPCKNDPTRSYAGTEPSPKGLGYCAHAEAEEVVRTGRDGLPWIVREDRRGVLSWGRQDALTDRLGAALDAWWSQLAESSVMVIYKNGSHAMMRSPRKTYSARLNDVERQWRAAGADPEVVAIVWSSPSSDNFTSFIAHIRKNVPKDAQEALANSWNPVALLAASHKKYFMKHEYYTKKDYTLKG